jgi:hypothetical protein
VDLGERVDELVADAPPLLRVVERRRHGGGHHVAVHPLHHVERRADHLLVVADGDHGRHARGGAEDRREQPRLAQHVMGRRRQRRARRAAQHPLAVVARDEERHVGVPLAHRLGPQRAAAETALVHERLQRAAHEQRRERQRGGLLRRVHDGRHGPRC